LFTIRADVAALIASVSGWFRSRAALQLEVLALRHRIGVLQRSVKRPKLLTADRLLWVWITTIWQEWKSAAIIVKPSTIIGWHRKGFRRFWTWKIRHGNQGRPAVRAPKMHGELLKLGIDIGETSVSKYFSRNRRRACFSLVPPNLCLLCGHTDRKH